MKFSEIKCKIISRNPNDGALPLPPPRGRGVGHVLFVHYLRYAPALHIEISTLFLKFQLFFT